MVLRYEGLTVNEADETMYQDYYGETCARLSRHDSIFADGITSKQSAFFRIVSLLLFHQPSVHLKQLREIYVDNLITLIRWTRFIERLMQDWENSITPVRGRSKRVLSVDHLFLRRRPCCCLPMSACWRFKVLTTPPEVPLEVWRKLQLTSRRC